MDKLYIDIDNTLVLWGGVVNELGQENWEVNYKVLEFLYEWLENTSCGQLIFWSSGGKDYAETMVRQVFTRIEKSIPSCTYLSKFNALPTKNSIFIDDSPFNSFSKNTICPKCFEFCF